MERIKGFQKGKNHSNWKGGKSIHSYGYRLVNINLLSEKEKKLFESMFMGHREKGNTSLVIYEHRLIMARKIGRPLLKKEEVHHFNGIKTDNRLENLALLESHNHKILISIFQEKIRELENKLLK